MGFADHIAAVDRVVRYHLGGVPVVYLPEPGNPDPVPVPVTVSGMFDEYYVPINVGEAGVDLAGPAVFLRLADLPVNPEDDKPILTILGKDYQVRERHPDGIGGILLLLQLAV